MRVILYQRGSHFRHGGAQLEAPWPLAPILLCLVLAWLVLALPWLSGHVTIPWDAKAHFLPQVQFMAASFARGEAPFWTPFVFSGHPQVADPQSLIFSPPFLLLSWLDQAPGNRTFDATIFAIVLMGQIGALLYGRARGWHWAGALVAAIAFGFGASMAWRIQHVGQVVSLAWFGVALWLLESALARVSWWRGLVAGLAIGLLASGRDQVALLCLFLLGLRVLVFWIDERRAAWRALFPAGLACFAVAALPVLLTFLLAESSNRPVIDLIGAGRGSLHPALLLTALVPDLFGASGSMEGYWGPPSFPWPGTGLYLAQNMGVLYLGAGPLILLLLGLARGHLWRRDYRFVTFSALFMLVYALGWYTPVFALLHHFLPGVDLFRRPADAAFPLGAMAALMAGQSLHDLLSGRDEGKGRLDVVAAVLVLAGMIGASVWLAMRFDRLEGSAFVIGSALAALLVSALLLVRATRQVRQVRGIAAGLLVLALVVDLSWHNRPNGATGLASDTYAMLDPGSRNETLAVLKRRLAARSAAGARDRTELVGLGFAWPNASLTHGLDNVLGYNPLRLGLYSEAVGARDHVALPDQRHFSPLFPSYRSLLADMLGLRFVVSGVPLEQIDKAGAAALTPIATTRDGFIYENANTLPRVMMVGHAQKADFAEILRTGAWPDFDPTRTVLLEGEIAGDPRPAGSARIVSYRNNEVVVDVDAPEGGWAMLNDPWQAWWRADLDGNDMPVLRANVLFRAVEVPPGRHLVRFHFAPIVGALSDLVAR